MTLHSLSHEHKFVRAKDINPHDLQLHLLDDHAVRGVDHHTHGEMGKTHLLAHAVAAYPDLREILDISEDWGGR